MEKIFEKMAIVLALFGFESIECSEENRAFVWRYKNVSSSKIARNYILAIAKAFGPDYSFGVIYTGTKGIMGKWGNHLYFTPKEDKGAWPTKYTLDVYFKNNCVGSFVLFIQ